MRRNVNAPARRAASKAPTTIRAIMPPPIPESCVLLPEFDAAPVAEADGELVIRVDVGALETRGVDAAGVVRDNEGTDDEEIALDDATAGVVELTGVEVVVVNVMTETVGETIGVEDATGVGLETTAVSVTVESVGTVGIEGRTAELVATGAEVEVPNRPTDAVESLDWMASEMMPSWRGTTGMVVVEGGTQTSGCYGKLDLLCTENVKLSVIN